MEIEAISEQSSSPCSVFCCAGKKRGEEEKGWEKEERGRRRRTPPPRSGGPQSKGRRGEGKKPGAREKEVSDKDNCCFILCTVAHSHKEGKGRGEILGKKKGGKGEKSGNKDTVGLNEADLLWMDNACSAQRKKKKAKREEKKKRGKEENEQVYCGRSRSFRDTHQRKRGEGGEGVPEKKEGSSSTPRTTPRLPKKRIKRKKRTSACRFSNYNRGQKKIKVKGKGETKGEGELL